jgi:DNA-binding GntR family transcriptional regulator
MSFQAMAWAVEQKTGSASTKLVLLILANYADNAGVCWPSQERLANDTDMTDRSIRNAVAALVERGLLKVGERRGTTGVRKTNVYRLALPETVSDGDADNRKNTTETTGNGFLHQPETVSSKPIKENLSEEPIRLGARKRAITTPEGFPFEADIRWTLKEHAKLSAWTEAEKFRDYALQHNKTYSDWSAAWRTWCRNAVAWSQNRRTA